MVYIVIPVHNRQEYTRNCLISLRVQTYKVFEIVVINDGSTDNTERMLRNEFPEVHIINGDGNLWWTAATNLGVKFALDNNAEYILTLNNDTVATKDFLEKMIYWAYKNPNALLGAFAVDAETKKPLYGGELINWKWATSKLILKTLPKEQWQGLHEVTHFPGRGLLIPPNVIREIGLYDEKHFPHYAADYDFTHRAIRAGFKVYCNYDAKLFVYPDLSGSVENRKGKSFKKYYNHLFGIKGGGNLFVFTKYAMKNCPNRYKFSFLFFGITRRIFGYLLKEN